MAALVSGAGEEGGVKSSSQGSISARLALMQAVCEAETPGQPVRRIDPAWSSLICYITAVTAMSGPQAVSIKVRLLCQSFMLCSANCGGRQSRRGGRMR
jgi:hypothetical protein